MSRLDKEERLYIMLTKLGKIARDSKGQLRDYACEYRTYHKLPIQRLNRSTRNKARRALNIKVGDPREVDHKVPLSKGGTNSVNNLQAISRIKNRTKFTS